MNDKYEAIREAAESDVKIFIKLVAPYMHLGAVHEELLDWATRQEGLDNKLILMPRDHLKSKMAAFIAAWLLTKDPTETILYCSSTADLAEKQLGQIKGILDSTIYRRYWRDMTNEEEGKRARWTVSEIIVDHPKRKQEGIADPSIKATGITGSITGFHASIVILDDLVTPNNAYTEDGRSKVAALYSQLASIESASSREFVVGTRYHTRDLYNDLIAMKEISFNDDEDEEEIPVYEVFQKVVETEGEFLWPRSSRKDGKSFGFDAKILARKKAKYLDTAQFYAQYYNDPNDPGSNAVDITKFQYYEKRNLENIEGTWFMKQRKLSVFASIDFAFSLRKAADSSAIVVVGVDSDNNYYVLDIVRFKTDRIKEYFDNILATHSKWGFRKIRAEVTVAQQSVVNELKEQYIKPNGLALSIDEYRPSRHEGDKAERISAILEPRYDNLQMWHYKGGNCQLLEEELVLKRPPHDDIKDALANAIAIAKAPAKQMERGMEHKVVYNTRFGGIR
jgi:phage terminase large subunit-like protein